MIGRSDSPRRLYLALRPIRLDTFLSRGLPPAVLIVACLVGSWPGLLATVVSTFGATYFLVEPPDSLEITTFERAVALGRPRIVCRSDCLKGAKPPRNGIADQESLRASV
jgi:hypothetical protein